MKTRMVHVRLTEEEYSVLVQGAEERGLKLASFLREKLGCSVQANGRPRKSEKKKKHSGRRTGLSGVSDFASIKSGESVDQFGFKRSLAKPVGKKK